MDPNEESRDCDNEFRELTTSNKNFKPPSTWAKKNHQQQDVFFHQPNGKAEPNGTSIPSIGPDATLVRPAALGRPRQGSKSCTAWLDNV